MKSVACETIADVRESCAAPLRDADAVRLRAILDSAVAAIITVDESDTIVDMNPATEALFGYTEKELIGKNVNILFAKKDLQTRDADTGVDQSRSGALKLETAGRQVIGRRKNGTTISLRLAKGEFTLKGRRFFTGIFRDDSERKEFELNLRSALKAANMVAMKWDCRTNTVSVTSGGESLAAFTRSVTTIDQLLSRLEPQDIETFRQEVMASARNRKPFRMTLRYLTPSGKTQWLELDGETEADAEGNPRVAYGMLMDVTEQKLAEARRDLLLAEIAHRGKNLLAIVQAIAAVTFQGDRPMDVARGEFGERIAALARSHALLTENEWSGVRLAEIIGIELAAHADQASIDVEDLLLKPNAAQSMSLVIHELTTNAIKYGALSVPGGRIKVEGRLGWREHREVLKFRWEEHGGPTVVAPAYKGYGSFLIEELLEGITDASTVDFRPEGLVVEAELPTAQLRPNTDHWSAGASKKVA